MSKDGFDWQTLQSLWGNNGKGYRQSMSAWDQKNPTPTGSRLPKIRTKTAHMEREWKSTAQTPIKRKKGLAPRS